MGIVLAAIDGQRSAKNVVSAPDWDGGQGRAFERGVYVDGAHEWLSVEDAKCLAKSKEMPAVGDVIYVAWRGRCVRLAWTSRLHVGAERSSGRSTRACVHRPGSQSSQRVGLQKPRAQRDAHIPGNRCRIHAEDGGQARGLGCSLPRRRFHNRVRAHLDATRSAKALRL